MSDVDEILRDDPGSLPAALRAAEEAGPIPTVQTHPTHPTRSPLAAPEPRTLDEDAPLVGSFAEHALTTMLRRAQGVDKPLPLPWPSLAQALSGGLWPGLHVLVGNTGSGKSQFALQLALHAARQEIPVLYIGLELGKTDLIARLLGLMSEKRWSRLWLGASEAEIDEVRRIHLEELQRLPFRLEFGPPMGWSYDRLVETTERVKERHKRAPLVVLDYLQLIASPTSEPSRDLRERIGRAAYHGRAVAREQETAVLVVSSTARDKYEALSTMPNAANPPPPSTFVGTGKESGEVEFAADTVLVLVRGESQPDATEIHLAIAKARAGKTGWQTLRFNGGWFWESPAPEDNSPLAHDPAPDSPAPDLLSQLALSATRS